MTFKRPGTGRQPVEYFELLGTKATRDYEEDEQI
jgi:sialic acid synthase SpsE